MASTSRRSSCAPALLLLIAAAVLAAPAPSQALGGFLDQFTTINNLTASGGPSGEGNPYGIALISRSMGLLTKGNYLLTNWNSAGGVNGQGHSIIQMDPLGRTTVFATIPNNPPPPGCNGTQGIAGDPIKQVGLTMALVVLQNGWVMVGNTPINVGGGVASTGCLIYLDYYGNIVQTLNGGLVRGPWGATVKDNGNTAALFVSMVLGANPASSTPQSGANGGYVVRYNLNVPYLTGPAGSMQITNAASRVTVASGFITTPGVSPATQTCAPCTCSGTATCTCSGPTTCSVGIEGGMVGPSGLAYVAGNGADNDDLYIADTQNDTIWVLQKASTCTGVSTGSSPCNMQVLTTGNYLNMPIGLNVISTSGPGNGNLLTANGGAGTLVEITPNTAAAPGVQVSARVVDTTNGDGAGVLFNAVATTSPCFKSRALFANDGFNTIMVMDP